jgi:phosphatidylglycerophosphate synthase
MEVNWTGRMTYKEFIANMRLIPNKITAIRFLAIPVMWGMAYFHQLKFIGIGLVIGLISDLLDGAVARKLGQTSQFGSKFDSLSDQLIQISALIWVLWLMPEMIKENWILSILGISIYFFSLMVGLIKFKQLANLHLYLSKLGGLFLYILLIHAFLTGNYHETLFILAAIFFILSSTETLVLQLKFKQVDPNMGSIFLIDLPEDHQIRSWLSRIP